MGDAVQPDVPKYIRVRDWLMEHILSSGFARGEKLPSESDLVRRFDVSRVTVRQALEALRAEGIIESRHGKGWFLRRICAVQNLGRLQGFGEMLAPMGVKVRSKVLEIKECTIPDAVATAFGLPQDSTVTQIARLRIAGGRVMSYDLSYFPVEIGRRLREHDLSRHDIFVLLERALRMPLGFADVTIEIAPADEGPAQQLGVKLATPIFKMTRLTHDLHGFPIDFEYVYGLPESHLFKVRVPRR
jgi:GntR family transcriptional regulator